MEEKKYEEWQDLPMDYDENNPYTQRFTYPNGDIFYVEPVFHLKLQGFKREDILQAIARNPNASKILTGLVD